MEDPPFTDIKDGRTVQVYDNLLPGGKVRAPPEMMPGNNRGVDLLPTESTTENNRLQKGKGEKAG